MNDFRNKNLGLPDGGRWAAHNRSEDDGISLTEKDWGVAKIAMGQRTVYGPVDAVWELAPGITGFSTSGHGGIKLSAERQKAIHPALRVKGALYEEDSEKAIVQFTFPEETRPTKAKGFVGDKDIDEHIEDATATVIRWYPDGYEKATGRTLLPGESKTKDERVWREAHQHHFVNTGAESHPTDETLVRVWARRESDDERRVFDVPKAEYRAGNPAMFAIDESRHVDVTPPPAPPVEEEPVPRYRTLPDMEKMTEAGHKLVRKHLMKRWRFPDGSIRTALDVITTEGLTGKSVAVEHGKRVYRLSGGSVSFPVPKGVYQAIEAPDGRRPEDIASEDVEIADYEIESFQLKNEYRRAVPRDLIEKQRKAREALNAAREARKAAEASS